MLIDGFGVISHNHPDLLAFNFWWIVEYPLRFCPKGLFCIFMVLTYHQKESGLSLLGAEDYGLHGNVAKRRFVNL